MLLDETFIASLSDNPDAALVQIVDKFDEISDRAYDEGEGWNPAYHEDFVRLLALAEAVRRKYSMDLPDDLSVPEISGNRARIMREISTYFDSLHSYTDPIKTMVLFESYRNAQEDI